MNTHTHHLGIRETRWSFLLRVEGFAFPNGSETVWKHRDGRESNSSVSEAVPAPIETTKAIRRAAGSQRFLDSDPKLKRGQWSGLRWDDFNLTRAEYWNGPKGAKPP